MVPGRSSRAVAVVVALWVAACAAALALATTGDEAVAQGCGGGGSPSPSGSASASESPAESELPIPVSLPPVPDGEQAAPEPPRGDPHEKVPIADTSQQAQQTKCKSTVTIAYESGKNPRFTGKVGSDEPMCKRARDVTVKKLKRGKDPTVGKAVTNAKGKYNVAARRANGRFYAKVAKATVKSGGGETITCLGAKSRTIRP